MDSDGSILGANRDAHTCDKHHTLVVDFENFNFLKFSSHLQGSSHSFAGPKLYKVLSCFSLDLNHLYPSSFKFQCYITKFNTYQKSKTTQNPHQEFQMMKIQQIRVIPVLIDTKCMKIYMNEYAKYE